MVLCKIEVGASFGEHDSLFSEMGISCFFYWKNLVLCMYEIDIYENEIYKNLQYIN